ncbi:hypothetical protein ACOSP7_018569 [Xanthoceras sorbifolium]
MNCFILKLFGSRTKQQTRTVECFSVGSILPVKARGDYMGASFFQQILEGSMVLCQRRLGTLGSCRHKKVLSRGVCSSFFYKARMSRTLKIPTPANPINYVSPPPPGNVLDATSTITPKPKVQPPADSDGEDLEEEPLIRHSSLKGKDKATLEDEKLSDSEVVGDDEIVVVPSGEKGIRTFARSVGGRKGVSDPSPSEP